MSGRITWLEVDSLIKEGFTYVVDADLASYFDTIPHDRLMDLVEQRISDGRVLESDVEAKPEVLGPAVVPFATRLVLGEESNLQDGPDVLAHQGDHAGKDPSLILTTLREPTRPN